jgi:hypothetical protein
MFESTLSGGVGGAAVGGTLGEGFGQLIDYASSGFGASAFERITANSLANKGGNLAQQLAATHAVDKTTMIFSSI